MASDTTRGSNDDRARADRRDVEGNDEQTRVAIDDASDDEWAIDDGLVDAFFNDVAPSNSAVEQEVSSSGESTSGGLATSDTSHYDADVGVQTSAINTSPEAMHAVEEEMIDTFFDDVTPAEPIDISRGLAEETVQSTKRVPPQEDFAAEPDAVEEPASRPASVATAPNLDLDVIPVATPLEAELESAELESAELEPERDVLVATATSSTTSDDDWAPPPAAAEPTSRSRRATEAPAPDLSLDRSPTPAAAASEPWLADLAVFREKTQSLARRGRWEELAELTHEALDRAAFANGATRAAMLLDLAQIYRDRLDDPARTDQAFTALAQTHPASPEALEYLHVRYEQTQQWVALYELYLRAVEETWDPHQRLLWTRQAAELADGRLNRTDLEINAWKQLWRLGDAREEAGRTLGRCYRRAGRWPDLVTFLQEQVQHTEGAARVVLLREMVEVLLSALGDAERAGQVLETIVAQIPNDPVAPLQLARVYAQRQSWDALEQLALQGPDRGMGGWRADIAADLRSLAAEALWQARRLEQAIRVYDALLQVAPRHLGAMQRKRELLLAAERFDELLPLLEQSAEEASSNEEKLAFLQQAGDIAEQQLAQPEKSIELWKRLLELDPQQGNAYRALERIYTKIDNRQGVAEALEGQLALVRSPAERITLMHRLADFYIGSGNDESRAERLWKDILDLDATDERARGQLMELHRRRGDFEALQSSLLRQIFLAPTTERALQLCRLAAENADHHLGDSQRSVYAWQRVLDLATDDGAALEALSRHYAAQQQQRPLIAVVERQVDATAELQQRIELSLRLAELWSEQDAPRAAAACYERILRWSPTDAAALRGLNTIYCAHDQTALALGAIDYACIHHEPSERARLLSSSLELLPEDAHHERFFRLRRVLALSDDLQQWLPRLEAEARNEPVLWSDVAAVLAHQASLRQQDDERVELLLRLAHLCEHELRQEQRAFASLQAAFFTGGATAEASSDLAADLERLAVKTKRFEELLTTIEPRITPEAPLEQRKQAIAQRAEICDDHLGDRLRALLEHRRALELDPSDISLLAALRNICEKPAPSGGKRRSTGPVDIARSQLPAELWRRYEATLAELFDRSSDRAQQLELLERRAETRSEQLAEPREALASHLARARLDPNSEDLQQLLLREAEAQNAWPWVLVALEAGARAVDDRRGSSQTLAEVARLYAEKLGDTDRALQLYAELFVLEPERSDGLEKLVAVADQQGAHQVLADTLRFAVSRTEDRELRLRLLRMLAALYEDQLEAPEGAIEIHQRLLEDEPRELASLDVVMAWHRQRGEWRDLRDRLRQRIEATENVEQRLPFWIEIATISRDRLSDAEGALEAYSWVLEHQPENVEAREGLEHIVGALDESRLRRRWMEIRIEAAGGSENIELQLELARLLDEQENDAAAAIAILQPLIDREDAAGRAFERLAPLLRREERWEALVDLLLHRESQLTDAGTKLATLYEALGICHEQLGGHAPSLQERLYERLIELRRADRDAYVRLARLLREADRWPELARLITRWLDIAEDVEERVSLMYEQARVLETKLNDDDAARRVYRTIVEEATEPSRESALISLAGHALRQGDTLGYMSYRKQQVALVSTTEGAFILCHLAEVCDEAAELKDEVVPLYREARALDANNTPAMEALKGIGRRLKSLRPAAALLPLEGERELPQQERAKRLLALAQTTMASDDLATAVGWLQRAVAIDPDNTEAWRELADALRQSGAVEQAYWAKRAWVEAMERETEPLAKHLLQRAQQLYELGQAARAAGRREDHEELVRRAFELAPGFAPAALDAAQAQLDAGDVDGARRLLHEILTQHRGELTAEQQVAALCARGSALRRLGKVEAAAADFREALQLNALESHALVALGEILDAEGRHAQALEHELRALAVADEPERRATLCYRIGRLLEDRLDQPEQAGAYYEIAASEGSVDRDLLHRLVRHFARNGRHQESLAAVDTLLQTAEAPVELATLWLARAQVLAVNPTHEDDAIEAFDMALSYDPGSRAARDGLVAVLERRGDWSQVLQVLEAAADVGSADERAAALFRMAQLASTQLGDQEATERYLALSVAAQPSREALEQLEQLYADQPERHRERLEVLGQLVAFGPPWLARCAELGQSLAEEDERWSWCLLSPLLGVSQIDQDLKARLQEMRKKGERPDLLVPSGDDYPLVTHNQLLPELAEILVELSPQIAQLPATRVADLGDSIVPMGPHTSLGKRFAALAESMGLPSCKLSRAPALPEPVVVAADGAEPHVVLRTDILQQLVHAELSFVFAYALELTRPHALALAALPAEQRLTLIPALWATLGLLPDSSITPAVEALAHTITSQLESDTIQRWKRTLEPLASRPPQELSASYWQGIAYTARRAGLIAGADMRQAWRVIHRLDESVSRPRVVARIDDLDEMIASSEALRDMVSFAASPAFGQLLRRATVVANEG